MKRKPLLIAIICLLVAFVCIFFFVKAKYFKKANTNEITQFVQDFGESLKDGNIDTIRTYFADGKSPKVTLLIKVLTGESGLNGKTKPVFKLSVDAVDPKIISANGDVSVVQVPVIFAGNAVDVGHSSITFTITRMADHQYKFTRVKPELFIKDYVAYENKVRAKTVPESEAYSAETLNAFKNAEKLKSKYDSVAWFDHVNKQTYYYVVKGTFNGDSINTTHFKATYRMGLVNPELQEIIPTDYDLVHNVNGTIDGLVEVQKDNKKGLYNLTGKLVVPVNYDQIYPLSNDANLAVLRNGDDFFYLKSDTTIGEKIAGFNISDALPKIKFLNHSFKLTDSASTNIMEYNSRENGNALVIPPSFLVDLGIIETQHEFTNPLRKYGDDEGDEEAEATASLTIDFEGAKNTEKSWLVSVFYSLYDDYIGGRGGLYQSKTVVLADKNKNRLMSFSASAYQGLEEGDGLTSDLCNENAITALGDSLYEFKTTSEFYEGLFDGSILIDGPYYHYLKVENGKLVAQNSKRLFSCTQFAKLNDSYMKSCYVIRNDEHSDNKAVDHTTTEMLRYMKNEIYASYGYRFKNPKWSTVFIERFGDYYGDNGKTNVTVDDSLTAIDKYNINWIDQKLKQQAGALAANNK